MCVLCGATLPLLPRSNRPRVYCSHACKRFYENHVLRHGKSVEEAARLFSLVRTVQTCPLCDRQFVAGNTRGTYCSDRCKTMCSRLPTYGLTIEQYKELQAKAGGVCYMCHRPQTSTLEVDHSHATGKFRGLVCKSCNYIVGLYEKGIDVKKKAIVVQYLLRLRA